MLFLLFLSVVPVVIAKNELYMGYKVYNVNLTAQQQQYNLHLLKTDIIDYLRKPNFKYGVMGLAMVPPSQFDWFEEKLIELNIERDIAIEDVHEYLLEKETEKKTRTTFRDNDGNVDIGDADETDNYDDNNDDDDIDGDENENGNVTEESTIDEIVFGYDDYYRYTEILNHIYELRDQYTSSLNASVEAVLFGVTEQNRPLVYLRISGINSQANKPVIVIEGGVNPREWITIPSALKIVDEILDEEQSRYLDSFDWIVIPVVNPDGYEYTHTDLRFWEKNLSTKSNLGFICPGVNINRNFNIDWSKSDSSSSACSHLYAGVEAVSEIETQLIQEIIETYKERISLYISLQNGGGFISYPWQYEFAASGMFRQNHLLGMEMIKAMENDYGLDVASVAFGDRASGTSSDYARINDAVFVFNIDIVSRGTDGVIVPEEEIVDIVEDVWRAVAVAADYIMQ